MQRSLFFRLIRLYILFYFFRGAATYFSYYTEVPLQFSWAAIGILFFIWLVYRFYQEEVVPQPAGEGDQLEIRMGQTVGADEPIVDEPVRDPAEQEEEGPPSDSDYDGVVRDGIMTSHSERFPVRSIEWLVWIKDQETNSIHVVNSELGHDFLLRKKPDSQRWVAMGKRARRRRGAEIDAGYSESLNDEKLEALGDAILQGRRSVAG